MVPVTVEEVDLVARALRRHQAIIVRVVLVAPKLS
jgi:hypothetical protein